MKRAVKTMVAKVGAITLAAKPGKGLKNRGSRHLALGLATAGMVICGSQAAFAFPSWIGVYGGFVHHDGENPGTYTILMNQDYYGLHAEVGIRVNGGTLNTHDMAYGGNTSGNSLWTYTPDTKYNNADEVEFYFRGYDNWGNQGWDNNGGANYTFDVDIEPSAHGIMGAVPYDTGTAFRVWAPNAQAVSVHVGDAGLGVWETIPMAQESTGSDIHWSADVEGAVPGHEYKYVITGPDGTDVWRMDPRGIAGHNDNGNTIIHDPEEYTWGDGGYSTPGFNEMVIYQLHVGTFRSPAGGGRGTFDTVTDELDYIASLGVNCIEFLPIQEFAGDVSMGYNPAHQLQVETSYGSPNDLKELVDEAHQRGIAVINDVVYNHMGTAANEHYLPTWNFDGEDYGWGGIYFYNDWKKETPWGWARPNYGRSQVVSYLRDSALSWTNEFHMDGLRWDSVSNITDKDNGGGGEIPGGWGVLQDINNAIHGAAPWKISIAEDLRGDEWITKTTGAGGAGFDTQWDGYVHEIRDVILQLNDADRDMWKMKGAVEHKYNGQASQRVIYTESHDEVAYKNGASKKRVPELIHPGNHTSRESQKRSTLAATVMMTSPGIPMIFMGQEMLQYGQWDDNDMMDWSMLDDHGGIKNLYTDLIKLRRNWYNNTRGLRGDGINVHHVNNTGKVIAYHRYESGGAGDDVIVVANFSNNTYTSYNIGFPHGGMWRVRFNSDWNAYSSTFDNTYSYDTEAYWGGKDGMAYNGNVAVGPWSAIILSQ